MTSVLSHLAVGLAITAIFIAGGFLVQPRVNLFRSLAGSVALAVAAALVVTAVRIFG